MDKILSLIQLLLAAFAVYSAFSFTEGAGLIVPLICLVLMWFVIRIEKVRSEKKTERDSLSKEEKDKVLTKGSTTIKDQNFSTIESLLWPKNELLLTDAVHSIIKDLGLKISTGIKYHSVDRIVKIPNTERSFGVEVLMSEREVKKDHPKLQRALEFEKEKREKEKTLIIASTHIHLPLPERDKLQDVSEETADLLTQRNISFMSTYNLYELWQKAKTGERDIFGIFKKLYSHPGGIFPLKGIDDSQSLLVDLSAPLDPL